MNNNLTPGDEGFVDFDPMRLLPAITSRYLLVINIPLYVGPGGRLFGDRLWIKDLAAHLAYITDFTLACPVIDGQIPGDAIPLSDFPGCAEMKLIRLPAPGNLPGALILLPVTVRRLWRAIAGAELVHSGVAGWPFPLGWIATPLARLLHRRTVIIIESAPWRLQPAVPAGLRARMRAAIYERFARWCIRATNLAIFTQDEYRRSFPSRGAGAESIIHASWIDEGVILSDRDAEEIWRRKALEASGGKIRFLFAGRLDAAKGIPVLLEAISLIAGRNIALQLDILGTGALAAACRALSDNLHGVTRLKLLGTVEYGTPLFQLLQQYHALVVPSVSDEQPRIVYDGYSQAIPVLGTSTPGLRDCVRHEQTGWLAPPGDPAALASLLERGCTHPEGLKEMGLRAVKAARAMTHEAMHRKRQRLLLRLLEQSRPPATDALP